MNPCSRVLVRFHDHTLLRMQCDPGWPLPIPPMLRQFHHFRVIPKTPTFDQVRRNRAIQPLLKPFLLLRRSLLLCCEMSSLFSCRFMVFGSFPLCSCQRQMQFERTPMNGSMCASVQGDQLGFYAFLSPAASTGSNRTDICRRQLAPYDKSQARQPVSRNNGVSYFCYRRDRWC